MNPYEKLRRAYEENRGTRLTAEDVDKLMSDTAVKDAVYQTHAEDDDDAPTTHSQPAGRGELEK